MTRNDPAGRQRAAAGSQGISAMQRLRQLAAMFEPFDSFWEAPDDIESGYDSFDRFYRDNYLHRLPANKDSRILCVSCGAGYLVKLLRDEGYSDVLGIDSFPEKVAYAEARGLPCKVAFAFEFLEQATANYDVIFCEQELNHLTRQEIMDFLRLCRSRLQPGGMFICFALNGANPITGAEALAQNFDHFNTFTEYTMRQVLEHSGFEDVQVFGLNLYVYYRNPANYVAMFAAWMLSIFFRACFILYGKRNRIFTKKFAATGRPAVQQ
jgi:2-polyprenyl-3-methyl-5-hydroxy-6-metoxy-1,4-benzoquinol methylase